MNSRHIQYAILLSELRNFSQAAESLGMSQPAFSKQIMNLEKDLGVKLFDRKSLPLKLTPAGEFFIREAKLLLDKETQLFRTMERFRSGEQGTVTIGITPFRATYLLPNMIRKFHEDYPGVQVVVREAGSNVLRQGAIDGHYDFAIVNLPVDESVLDIIPLESDTLVLAIPTTLSHTLPCADADTSSIPEIAFEDCKDLPFIVVGSNQEMRQLFDRLCARSSINPHIACEVVGITTAWSMANAGIGATLLPLQFINSHFFEHSLRLYKIKDAHFVRQPCIISRHGQYRSEFAQHAIDLLIDNYSSKTTG